MMTTSTSQQQGPPAVIGEALARVFNEPKFAELVERTKQTAQASWDAREREDHATVELMAAVVKDRFPTAETFILMWDYQNDCPDSAYYAPITDADGAVLADETSEGYDAFCEVIAGFAALLHLTPLDFTDENEMPIRISEVEAGAEQRRQNETTARRSRIVLDTEAVRARWGELPTIRDMSGDEQQQIGRDVLQDPRVYEALDEAMADQIKAYWSARSPDRAPLIGPSDERSPNDRTGGG
jgi:hypothetical protein